MPGASGARVAVEATSALRPRVSIERVDAIPRTKMGKVQLVRAHRQDARSGPESAANIGRWPRTCAAFQTTLLITMTVFELSVARDLLLLAPASKLLINGLFLGLGWYLALHTPRSA
jgi:hypothetical protein